MREMMMNGAKLDLKNHSVFFLLKKCLLIQATSHGEVRTGWDDGRSTHYAPPLRDEYCKTIEQSVPVES